MSFNKILYLTQYLEFLIPGKEDVVYVYIYNGIPFSHEKEENPAICDNMDGPWGHYAKWDKSHRERQILYDLTETWNLKKPGS